MNDQATTIEGSLNAATIKRAAKRTGYSAGYIRRVINHGADHEGTARKIAVATGVPLKLLLYGLKHQYMGAETRVAGMVAAKPAGLGGRAITYPTDLPRRLSPPGAKAPGYKLRITPPG